MARRMTQSSTSPDREQRKRRLRWRHIWVVLRFKLALIVAAVVVSLFVVKANPVQLPGWVTARVETRISASMAGGAVTLGSITVRIEDDWTPRLQLRDVGVFDGGDQPLARLSDIRARFSMPALMQGQIRPKSLRLFGADVALRRLQSGQFDLSFGDLSAPTGFTGSVVDVLEAVDRAFGVPALTALELVEVEQLNIRLADARTGKTWQVEGGGMTLDKLDRNLSIRVGFDLLGDGGTVSTAAFTFQTETGSPAATLGATIRNMPAAELAAQAPALSWLAVLDAPISGALRVAVNDAGQLGTLNGTLDIGKGVVQPTKGTKPVVFSSGRAYFSYDPEVQMIAFNELSVVTDAARIKAEGKAYLREMKDGWPQALLGQVRFTDVLVNPPELFEEPVAFNEGALDFRLRLDPFTMDVGQLLLSDGDRELRAKGKVFAAPEGWDAALDVTLNAIPHDRLLALWPAGLVPKTREWISTNVRTGLLFDVEGAVRFRPNEAPRLSLGYEFSDAEVKFLKTLPTVQGGHGYATVEGNTYTMVLDKGEVPAKQGGFLNVAGTVFKIPDVTRKPAISQISVVSESTITAAMSILDEAPFNFIGKAQQPVDLAEGRAKITAQIEVALQKGVPINEVVYQARAVLTGVRTDKLVKGHVLTAPELAVTVDRSGLTIEGAGKVDRVPVRAAWRQNFGPEGKGKSRVEGTVALSQDFIDDFGIGLPKGSVTGEGEGAIAIDLVRGQAPAFSLASDLMGVGLRIPALGWAKPPAAKGRLAVSGNLGTPPQINAVEVDVAGLKASGRVDLDASGGLTAARFSRVRIGGWLDAPVDLVGRGRGRPVGVSVKGGSIDIRKTTFSRRAGGAGASGPIGIALDRLVVSEGITLTDMRGNFGTNGGFNGNFTARVNGGAPVTGTLAPSKEGTAIRITSGDAGGVMRSAGLFEKGFDGSMDLTLVPRREAGTYDGRLTGRDISVRGASAMAELLSAISVVGLLEQMNGDGLMFNDVQAGFRMTPTSVTVTQSSATGASLGLSMDGFFDLVSKRMDMQGVVSPIYLLNGIGSIFTRKGEGLFGFNFTMKGPASDPSVSVNPLSIFTPGMFREIFRRAPPEVTR